MERHPEMHGSPPEPQPYNPHVHERCETCNDYGYRIGLKRCSVCGQDTCESCEANDETVRCVNRACRARLHDKCGDAYTCPCGCDEVYCPGGPCQAELAAHFEDLIEGYLTDPEDAQYTYGGKLHHDRQRRRTAEAEAAQQAVFYADAMHRAESEGRL